MYRYMRLDPNGQGEYEGGCVFRVLLRLERYKWMDPTGLSNCMHRDVSYLAYTVGVGMPGRGV